LAGENFGEFGNLLQICQSFIRQLLVTSEKAMEAGLKSTKVFFTKCNLACNSPKFSPAKIFCYTVCFLRLILGVRSIRGFEKTFAIPIMNPISWFMI